MENSKLCSQDQAITRKNHQFDVSPGKPSSRLFSSKKVEANRQALYERCECELVHELTQSRLQIS